MSCYCEICGREISNPLDCRKVVLDNAVVTICPQCYRRLSKQGRIKPYTEAKTQKTGTDRKWTRTRISKKMLETMYEVVEDYSKRIREARQRLGWSQAVLAQKARVGENVIKRIEAGRLKPSIELARRLERLLGIVLLEPIVEETTSYSSGGEEDYLTIGDIIKIRDEEQ